MAGLGGKNWTFQEEVTSSDVNGYLADQVVMRFADSTARTAGFGGSGEPTLAEGMVSYLDDTNTLAVYNGSAWVNVADADAPPALQLVKTQTIGSAVSSVEVTSAFSADFDNYRIDIFGGVASATSALRLTLGSTSTGYYYSWRLNTWANSPSTGAASNATFYLAGDATTNLSAASINVFNPFAAEETVFFSRAVSVRTDGYYIDFGGYLNNTTSYTAFTITPSTGTLTGGTIRVYGYRNS